MNTQQILKALDGIQEQVEILRKLVTPEEKEKEKEKPKPEKKAAKPPQSGKLPKRSVAISLPTPKLVPAPDWRVDEWPEAVPEHLIVTEDAPETEKQYRAVQIVNMVGTNLAGKKILDFGCGSGYTTLEFDSRDTSKVVGYDIKQFSEWGNSNVVFTTKKEDVRAKAPYDIIVLYDVLDHMVDEDPAKVLSWLKGLLVEDGYMFLRLHPWTARHGGHSYEHTNKAYIHLLLTADELEKAGIPIMPCLRLNRPLAAYEAWIKFAGLKTVKRDIQLSTVEKFFSGDILRRIIQINWAGKQPNEAALKILSNQFIDYTLEIDKSAKANGQ